MRQIAEHGEVSARELARNINQLISGDNNANADIVLSTGTQTVITTSLSRIDINPNSCISFMPQSSDAATELHSGDMFVSETKKGEFTITHSDFSDGFEYRIQVSGGSGL